MVNCVKGALKRFQSPLVGPEDSNLPIYLRCKDPLHESVLYLTSSSGGRRRNLYMQGVTGGRICRNLTACKPDSP